MSPWCLICDARIRFGLNTNALDTLVLGTSNTYQADQMCDAPANVTSQVCMDDLSYIR